MEQTPTYNWADLIHFRDENRIACPGREIGPDMCCPGRDFLLWRIQLPAAQDKQSA